MRQRKFKRFVKAIKLIVGNAARAAALDGTTGFMLFIGKLFVALGSGALTWAFFSGTFQVSGIIRAKKLLKTNASLT